MRDMRLIKVTVDIEDKYHKSPDAHDSEETFLSKDEYSSITRKVIDKTLELEKCPFEAEVSLLLVNDEKIRDINLLRRALNVSTDVLSFPMIDFKSPSCFDDMEEDISLFDPDTGELLLGDIVISIDHVISQAKNYGHSIEREYAFLIAHSMLHLLGYDHESERDASIMESRQEEILGSLGLTR